MRLNEAIKNATDKESVYVLSYGYTETTSCISRHFEPFSKQRTIKFKIEYDKSGEVDCLYNRTFWFAGGSYNHNDFYIEDGKIKIFDPDLYSRSED